MQTIEEVVDELVPELKTLSPPTKLGFWGGMKKVWSWWKDGTPSTTSVLPTMLAAVVVLYTGIGAALFLGLSMSHRYPGQIDLGKTCEAGFTVSFVCVIIAGITIVSANEQKWARPGPFEVRAFICMLISLFLIGCGFGPMLGIMPAIALPTLPMLSWVGQALYWMKQSRITVPNTVVGILPSPEDVQKRVLGRMKTEVDSAREQVQGPDSVLEKRLAELKAKKDRAQTLKQRAEQRFADTNDPRFGEAARKADEAVTAFAQELTQLIGEQNAILELFREVELFIPAEEARVADDRLLGEIAEICGEARTARQISREMLLGVVTPVVQRIAVLNSARERLLSHSLAALEGPGSVEKFLAAVDSVTDGASKLEGTLRRIESVPNQNMMS